MLLSQFFLGLPIFLDPPTFPYKVYLANLAGCLLKCPNHLSFLILTIFSKLSLSPIHRVILDRTSQFVKYAVYGLYRISVCYRIDDGNHERRKMEESHCGLVAVVNNSRTETEWYKFLMHVMLLSRRYYGTWTESASCVRVWLCKPIHDVRHTKVSMFDGCCVAFRLSLFFLGPPHFSAKFNRRVLNERHQRLLLRPLDFVGKAAWPVMHWSRHCIAIIGRPLLGDRRPVVHRTWPWGCDHRPFFHIRQLKVWQQQVWTRPIP